MKSALSFLVVLATMSVQLLALPLVEAPVPLPPTFEGVITVYPDSNNTVQIRQYWIVPSTVRIFRNPDKTLAFGLIHSGVSSFDPDGINALLNITAQAYVDSPTLQSAKDLIQKQATSEGATTPVTFTYISPIQTSARLLIGGQYAQWGGQNALVVNGGAVEAGIPFQVKLDKSFDVRALTQAGGPKAARFGIEFRMKYNGLGAPCEIHLNAKFTETYQHFVARVKASGWFGLVNADMKNEWQDLKKQPWLSLDTKYCSDDQIQKYHISEIFNTLMTAITNRTGLFAKELKPSGLPDAPGGGGIWGWSLSAGGGFESYTDTTDFHIDLSLADKQEREIVYGLNFPTGGQELESYVVNLTDTNKPYPTDADFKSQAAQLKLCRGKNIDALKQLLASGTINQSLYDQLIANALTKGCYVDYSLEGKLISSALQPGDRKRGIDIKVLQRLTSNNRVSISDRLRFTLP